MTKSKPPALAAWMLEHMQWGGKNEALAGDLLEEFQRRRSASWYWRQVIGAIFASLSNEVRADWTMVWTVLFTVVWAYSLYAIPVLAWPVPMTILFRLDHYLVAHGYYGTPVFHIIGYGFRYVMPFLFHVAAPLGIFLAGAGNLNLRAFTHGLCAAVVATLCLRVIPFQPVLDYLSMHGLAMYWTQLWKWYEVMVMYQFIPLIVAIWAARSRRKIAQPRIVAS
ncbi:MAG: hypothetical protein EPN47_12340 [Acidobacteria bacterium]|nr:MAG: hypothetical protein EPN47_12340 [Acidobacteriota bacterium]